MKELSPERIALKVDVIGPENMVYTHVHASFSPEILHAGSVKGLSGESKVRVCFKCEFVLRGNGTKYAVWSDNGEYGQIFMIICG